jgi:DNA invertase Pin-like site-specific DNA recombinase
MSRKSRFTKHERIEQQALADNRIVSYVRASTEDQVNSLDAQKMRHADFAHRRELLIDETFTGAGVSATKTDFLDRTEVKAMLRHMKKRGIRTILLLRVDRVFRSTRDFQLSLIELEQQGIFLRFIDPDIDYSTPVGRMMIQQLVMLAEFEGQLRGQRQDDACESLRSKRVAISANTIAYGWIADGESEILSRTTGKRKIALRPNPDQQAVLRWLKAEYERDHSYGVWTRLANQLNSRSIPTRDAKTWKAANVQSVLRYENLATDEELGGSCPSFETACHRLANPNHTNEAAA